MLATFVIVVLPALVTVAAVADLMTMTIPNRLVLTLMVAFGFAAPLAGLTAHDVMMHAGAAALVLAIGVALFVPGWVGGGDAKLAAALALWLGFDPLLDWFLMFALFGGALTLATVYYRNQPLPARLQKVDWIARLHHPKSGVPYGIALAAGTLILLPHTTWFAGLV